MRPPTAWMPNGANPLGRRGSVNAPGLPAGANAPSHTSTRPLWKSVAYRRGPPGVEAIARPLKIAPAAVAAVRAAVPNAGFQPLITPASDENRKRDGSP